jgi:methylthioribose-1-phosphate isomerase
MAIAARLSCAKDWPALIVAMRDAKAKLDASRPTAVNLSWATERLVRVAQQMANHGGISVAQGAARVLAEAKALAEDDVLINRAIGEHGAKLVPPGANIVHHCNTGALATVDYGTALGIIYACHEQGKNVHVWVDETRPRLQGARLTAWELMAAKVPMHLVCDGASGLLMRRGKVDVVLFGADRVAANGDVVNKIGTLNLAVVAREHGVAVYAAVPTSTIDLAVANGDDVHIEERDAREVTHVGDVQLAPEGVAVYNPAFDVTPARYLTAIVTEVGVCYPPFSHSLRRAKEEAEARVRREGLARIARYLES